MATIDPPPYIAPIAEGQNNLIGGAWYRWFQSAIYQTIKTTPVVFSTRVDLTGQHAAIGTTNITLPALTQGQYLISYYVRVQVPDAVASTVNVNVGWVDEGVVMNMNPRAAV